MAPNREIIDLNDIVRWSHLGSAPWAQAEENAAIKDTGLSSSDLPPCRLCSAVPFLAVLWLFFLFIPPQY